MKNLVRFILSVVLLLTAVSLHAQNAVYPIQINATMLPPYTNCLGDYFNSGAKRAQVKVILRDISRYDKSLKFSLKVTVKRGNTVMLESTTPYPITLTNANVINDLSEHVAGLFSPNSVNHGGSYADNGYCLPEGSYEFVFQAFDFYRRNMPLSEPFSMFCYLNQAEPPILVYPEDGACGIGDAVTGVGLTRSGVQFQWMDPIATGPTNKTYELVLTEKNKTTDLVSGMFPNSSSSNNVLNLPLYNEKIHNNTFRFVPSSIFTEENEYCWHVVASGGNLTGNNSAFKNGGKSETNCFTYGACPNKEEFFDNKKIKKTDDKLKVVLTEVNVNNEQKNAEAKWESKSGSFCKYYVYYYRKDLTDASAEKAEINDLFSLSTVLKNLEPGEEYSCYVIGVTNCDNKNEGEVLSPKSNEISFKLEKKEPEDEKCEANLDTRPCESLLETLNEKDYFYGTTSAEVITVTEITARGEDHSFSGKGIVSCTLLKNKVGLNVTFDNIQINSERYLCKGEVDAVHDSVDNLMVNLNDYFGNKQNTKNTKQQEDLGTEVQDLNEAKNHKNETIIYNGELYAVDENGNPDKVGEVKKNGDLCDVPGSGLDNRDGVVVFDVGKGLNKDKANPYDPYIDRSIDPFYSSDNLKNKYENQSYEYPIPWIAMVEGDTRWIEAHVAGKSKEAESTLKIDDVDFYCYTADGSAVKLIKEKTDGNSVKLKIYGGKPKTSLKIYARMNAEKNGGKCPDNVQTLGVAKIYSMSHQTKKILLAPVLNELTLNVDEMQMKVNEMFAPLGKRFEFTVGTSYTAQQDPYLTDLLKDGVNTDEGENHFTKETKEMKYLRRNYSEYATDISGYDACLFLIPKARKPGLEGYMPLNKSVGYIVVGENDNITLDAATIAHELCHGLFCLRHTFDYGVVEGHLPENLMDYPKPDADVSERYLTKYFQWNDAENGRLIHLSFLDDVEDGEYQWRDLTWLGDVAFGYTPFDDEEKAVQAQLDFFIEAADNIESLGPAILGLHSTILNKKLNKNFNTIPDDDWSDMLITELLVSGNAKLNMGQNTFVTNQRSADFSSAASNIVLFSYKNQPKLSEYRIKKIEDMSSSSSRVKAGIYFKDGKSFGIIPFYTSGEIDAVLLIELHEKKNFDVAKEEFEKWVNFLLMEKDSYNFTWLPSYSNNPGIQEKIIQQKDFFILYDKAVKSNINQIIDGVQNEITVNMKNELNDVLNSISNYKNFNFENNYLNKNVSYYCLYEANDNLKAKVGLIKLGERTKFYFNENSFDVCLYKDYDRSFGLISYVNDFIIYVDIDKKLSKTEALEQMEAWASHFMKKDDERMPISISSTYTNAEGMEIYKYPHKVDDNPSCISQIYKDNGIKFDNIQFLYIKPNESYKVDLSVQDPTILNQIKIEPKNCNNIITATKSAQNTQEKSFTLNVKSANFSKWSDKNNIPYISLSKDSKELYRLYVIPCERRNYNIHVRVLNGKDKNGKTTKCDGFDYEKIKNAINTIYNPINVYFNFDNNPEFISDYKFNVESGNIFTPTDYYKVNEDKYSILIIPSAYKLGSDGLEANGYAPPHLDYPTTMNVNGTAAVLRINDDYGSYPHELGHLIFGLWHPFDMQELPLYKKGADIRNLMDYAHPSCNDAIIRAYDVLHINGFKGFLKDFNR